VRLAPGEISPVLAEPSQKQRFHSRQPSSGVGPEEAQPSVDWQQLVRGYRIRRAAERATAT
jgi:hypothetical protein